MAITTRLPAAMMLCLLSLTVSSAQATRAVSDAYHSRIESCVSSTLACGQVASGELGPSDCTFSDGTYFDSWNFAGSKGSIVEVVVTALDTSYSAPLLVLAPPTGDASKTPIISATSKSVTLSYVLSSTGTWTIAVGTDSLADHGRYSVKMTCFADLSPNEPQNCIEQILNGCPQWMEWYLTASGCRFSDGGGPYQYQTFTSFVAGDRYHFLVVADFTPGLAVFSDKSSSALTYVYAPSGASSVSLDFVSPAAGNYYVDVLPRQTNSVGFFRLDTTCVVTACTGPTITQQPVSVTVPYNSIVTLSVRASSAAAISYHWFDYDDPIAGAQGFSSDFTTPRLTKTTTYAVDITSQCGSTRATATVTVQPPRHRSVRH